MNGHRLFAGAAVAVITLRATAAAAGTPSAVEILGGMEKTMNDFKDQQMDVRISIFDVDGSKKAYEFSIQQKGDQKRLIKFTSGEIKGMASLILDRNNMYVYLPGYKKVRRVAAHNMNQSFAGSDITNDDMATVSWTKAYDVSFVKEDEKNYHLLCTPKAGEPSEYSKVDVVVEKKTWMPRLYVYYAKSGEKIKTWDMKETKDFGGVLRNAHITIIDNRTGHKTIMEVLAFKVNLGLDDDLFTVRELQWGK